MAAIGTQRAQAIRDAAREAGISDGHLTKLADLTNVDDIQYMSGRGADALETDIDRIVRDQKARQSATAEALRLAKLGGHNADAIAAKLETMATPAIETLVQQTRAYLNGKGIDTRVPAAPTTQYATPAQVDYIMDLLARRQRSGEGGGFFTGPTTRDEVAKMTRENASAYITSLKGDY